MALRNVPKSYTFDQQRQEINDLAVDVGDITQLANGLPSVVAAINTLQAGSADGGELLSGPAAPTAGDGANGDFWLDTSTNDLYGPKENGAWPATTVSFSEQILSGIVAPLSTLGKVNDYYFDSAKKELYGPKTASGWGVPTSLGEADYQNVLFVKPNGSDSNTGASPSKAFQSIKAAAKAAAATDGNTTIRVATGKYYEDNPIYLPNGTSIVGDNLRETIVIPQNEGRDLFWITSGCYVNYMVFEDNFSGGLGYLETESTDNRTLTAVDQTFRVLPGSTLTRNDVVFGDAANQIEFKKTDLIASAIADMLVQFPALSGEPQYNQTTCERDLGLVADAIIADLRAGGNVKSIQAGLAYRTTEGQPIASTAFTPTDVSYVASTGVLTFTLAGHSFTDGDKIKLVDDSLSFTCGMGNGFPHTWVGGTASNAVTVNGSVQKDVTDAAYTPTTGVLELTIGSHSYTSADTITIATDSLTFTCDKDSNATNHTYPRTTDPANGESLPIISATATTISVNVGAVTGWKTYPRASDPASNTWLTVANTTLNTFEVNVGTTSNVTFTPTDADYNPTTGLMELTIGAHSLTAGTSIKLADNSLKFTCGEDGNATNHTYPRATDPFYDTAINIESVTATTITIQVLSTVPSTNVTPHTFVSATGGAVISGGDYSHTFVSAETGAIVSSTISYGGELIPEIEGEEIEQMFAIERLSYHAQAELLNNPSSDPSWPYTAIIQDTAGYPACARAQAFIGTSESIITSIMQGDDVPQYHVGPGFILIDQEWMEVLDFNLTTDTFTVTRGVNNPITGEATVADKHITGAFISQSGFTWRYAIAYPEQSGYQGKGRVTLNENSPVVLGGVNTAFTEEFQVGWSIKVNGNNYTIQSIDSDTQLTLSSNVPVGQEANLDIYYVIPPQERIFLSPYTQNCSCISKLGRAVYDINTREYDASKTRAGGLFADGAQLDSNSPLESMVADAFTQIVFGSIGFHLKNDAYAQLVSVFQVFESVGILAESGGYVSITNSATNFGDEGLKALGFSSNVLPIFSGGQLSSIQNITKTDINTSPSNIIGISFSSEAGGTSTRATIEVSIVDIGKFERGQTITISNHIATPDINGAGKVIDTVDFQSNRISIIEQIAYDAATFIDSGTTGEIEIASGAVFTKINVTGYQAPPIPNYVLQIPGLGLDPTGNQHVVGEVLSYDAGNFTEFTTNFPIQDSVIANIGNNATSLLFAPSTVNSSSHTFEYVGAGINYTAFPQNGGITDVNKQTVEVSSGKTYVSATDQSGNFGVGPYFNVNLRSGKVTFNGSVALGVLDSLQLKGSPGVPIFEFSPDDDLGGAVGRSDTVLPTQKAVRDYINKTSVLGNFIGLNKGTSSIPGLVVQLDATGKIDSSQIPQTSTFVVYTVETAAERLQTYIPVASKTIVSNTANTITLNSVTDLIDGLVVTGTNIPSNTRIVIGGIDVATNTITVDQTLPTGPGLTAGDSLSFLGDPLKAGDIVIQKNEADGDPLTLLQTWILTALPGTDANNWELIALNQLDAAAIVSGLISPSRLGTGVANDDTYLNGLNKFTPVVKGVLPPTNSAITVAGTAETLKKTGTPVDVSAITWAANVATVTTASAHLLTTDDYVEIEQVVPDTYNGLYQVTVTNSTVFTYSRAGYPGSYLSNGIVTSGELNESGFIELDVDSVSYTTGQSSGSSSRGVASFLYNRFTIDTQNVVDLRDKSITLGKIQNIAPKTLLGNNGALASNPQEIEIGVGVAGVPTFEVSLQTNRYVIYDENVGKSYGQLPDLQLVAGKEYVFRLADVTGHPFNIVTSPGSIGANLYTDGVIGNGSSNVGDLVRITVPQDAPLFLYYQSGLDANNFGIIKIVKIGDNLEVVDSTSSATIVLDAFPVSRFDTAEYLIQAKNTVNPSWVHSTKLLVVHDGTNTYVSEFSSIQTVKSLGSFTSEINNGNVELKYSPEIQGNDYLNRLIIQKNYVSS